MPPAEIGAAAAYEVFRTWRYHYGIIAQPLSGDRERQREALIGLAVGEGMFYPIQIPLHEASHTESLCISISFIK